MTSRRTVLKASIAGSVFAALPTSFAAFAQNKQIIVTNWGGDWNGRYFKYIEGPLLESQGYSISHVLNSTGARKTKLRTQTRLPVGRIDVAHFARIHAADLRAAGVLQKLDYSKIPNADNLVQGMKQAYFLPNLYSGWEMVYNPNEFDRAPMSFSDMWDSELVNRVGIENQNWPLHMFVASLLASGTLTDFEGAKDKLMQLKRLVKPKVYPTHQQLAAALTNGDVVIGGEYRARALQFQSDGVPVDVAFPKEGPIARTFGATIPKKAPHLQAAYAYLNAMLNPLQLAKLCEANFYAPASNNVQLSEELVQSVAYSEEQQKSLHLVDTTFWQNNNAKWFDWWQSEFLS